MLELLKLMDETIPIPERPIDKTFMMSVDSTFTIPGRGTVVTGTIEQGRVKVGEDIEIVGYSDKATKTTVTGSFLLLRRSRDLPEEPGGGRGGRQLRHPLARHPARGHLQGAVPGQAGHAEARAQLRGQYLSAQGGGRRFVAN